MLVIIFRQPGANIIDTVDRVKAMLPQLKADMPPTIDMRVAMDQTLTIRASVHDVERTLIISVILVILVVFVFLRNVRGPRLSPVWPFPCPWWGPSGSCTCWATVSTISP